MAYKTYTVKPGDSLSKIARQLNLGGWQELYNLNKKVIGSNPNLIYAGQTYNIPGTYQAPAPVTTTPPTQPVTTTPSQSIGKTIAEPIWDPTRQNFIDKYGLEEALRPDAMFHAVAEEQVNPEQMRLMSEAMEAYDRRFNLMGGYLSAGLQAQRNSYVDALERSRKEAINEYIQSQNQLFNKWYNQEMQRFMESKAPSDYTLQQYAVPTVAGGTPYKPGTKYEYTPALDATNIFRYGGYSAPAAMYNAPTPVS